MDRSIFIDTYKPSLNLVENEKAIKEIRNYFENKLADKLHLIRVTAPLFVLTKSGLNDGLSGVEQPVKFNIDGIDSSIEIVHSLAKWKRMNIKKYDLKVHEGLYTDMNAIRKDENIDNYHSIYVDQWDYEFIINEEDRNMSFLKKTVSNIYEVIRKTEQFALKKYNIPAILPENITFIESEKLLNMYPELTPDERVNKFVKEKGAIFVIGIGHKLSNGIPHDTRACDYDDWNLNGDIFVYNPILDNALELSSMGIRVDSKTLKNQLKLAKKDRMKHFDYQQKVLNNELPLTLGGGIGQSRICMFMLKKLHIGEVQSSIWSENTRILFKNKGVTLL